ncbi:MAG: MFS transporter [Candidatus Dadabacteria bacterium]|nr:MFS transporter [Candidatus Dadabacteria bacterium]
MAKYSNDPIELDVEESKSLLSREFILTTLSSFIFFFNFHAFLLLPIRIQELGGSASTIGFIMGVTGLSTIFTTPAVGVLVDRLGKKRFLLTGGLMMSLTTLPFAYLDRLDFLFPLLRVMHGAAFSLCFISAGTLVADVTPVSRRSQALGLFGVFTIINYALAPYVGKLIIEAYSFKSFFLVFFVVGLSSFLISLLIREPSRVIKHEIEGSSILTTLFRKGVFVSAFTLMIAGSGFIPTLIFFPVFAMEIKVEAFHLFFIAYTLSALFVRLFGGWIPDRFGKKRAVMPSLFLFSISVIWIAFASSTSDFVETGILFGLSHGLLYPSVYALVIDLSPVVDRGKAFAICSVAFTVGGMLGSFIYGIVAEFLGFHIMYIAAGGVCLIGFIVFSAFGREHP